MKRKSSRRDFLKGQSAAEAMADAIGEALPEKTPNRAAGRTYQIQVSRRAMACQFEVSFNAGQYENDTEAALEALDLVDALEDQLSVFRQHSEISRINRTAAAAAVEVEPKLFELLERALRLCEETGGAFDVTSAPLWEVWGFARRAGAIPNEEQIAEAQQRVGSHLVELDSEHRMVRFRRPDVQLNLGGLGKGFALDRCAEKLRQADIGDFLIHGGYSSVLGQGSRVIPQGESREGIAAGWRVGIRHPLRGDRRLGEIRLLDRALATSGSWAQSFTHEGRRYAHILDPRTGQPAEGVLSATVIAPTATWADALSTAFFVMGPDAVLDYCQTRPEIAAVLVCPIRHSGGLEIRTAGVSDDLLTIF